ncbi:MAG: hypothetical protein AAFR17_20780 [Pseudomonadota bacterium]
MKLAYALPLIALAACAPQNPYEVPAVDRVLRIAEPVGGSCISRTASGDVVLASVPGELVLPARNARTPVECTAPDGTVSTIKVHQFAGPDQVILELYKNNTRYNAVAE